MPYKTGYEKFKLFLLYLLTRYLVWIIIAAVIIIWYFFPEWLEQIGQVLLFWGPAVFLLLAFFILSITNWSHFKRDREQGIGQYDIIITPADFIISDLIVYGGSVLILIAAFIFKANGVEPVDLILALIFFILSTWLKQLFLNKIYK